MSRVPLCLGLLLGLAQVGGAVEASPAAARKHISATVWKTGSLYSINESSLRVTMHVQSFLRGFSFSGMPFSGHISETGTMFQINGGGVNATVHSWGDSYRVNATFHDAPRLRLDFNMHAIGRSDDPDNPPGYSLYESRSGAQLRIWPSGRNGYRISGSIDPEKFGARGTALVGLVTVISMHMLQAGEDRGQ